MHMCNCTRMPMSYVSAYLCRHGSPSPSAVAVAGGASGSVAASASAFFGGLGAFSGASVAVSVAFAAAGLGDRAQKHNNDTPLALSIIQSTSVDTSRSNSVQRGSSLQTLWEAPPSDTATGPSPMPKNLNLANIEGSFIVWIPGKQANND